MIRDPLTVTCPDCGAAPKKPCTASKGATLKSPHTLRFVQVSRHPAMAVPCHCRAKKDELCINLRCFNKRNSSFHDQRDEAAYAAGHSAVVPGLFYPRGGPVRSAWVLSDRRRKVDQARSVKFRKVGTLNFYLWASTFDDKIWYADNYKDNSLKAALKARESIIDAVAALAFQSTTIWSDRVRKDLGPLPPQTMTLEEDEGEAPAHYGDCDHAPCTGH
jgi:hypothetical protein